MDQAKLPGMKRLAGKRVQKLIPFSTTAVGIVSNERIANGSHMHSNLMCPARIQNTFNQGRIAQPFLHFVTGARLLAPRHDRHPSSVDRMAANRTIDNAPLPHHTQHQRQIMSLDGPRLKLPYQIGLRLQGFCHDQQACSVFIQTMHDASPGNLRKFWNVMKQGIQKSSGRIAIPGVDHQAGGLIYHQHVTIFVDDVQGNILGAVVITGRSCRIQKYFFATPQLLLRIEHYPTIHLNQPLPHPGLETTAGVFGKQGSKDHIEALTSALVRHIQAYRAGTPPWDIIGDFCF